MQNQFAKISAVYRDRGLINILNVCKIGYIKKYILHTAVGDENYPLSHYKVNSNIFLAEVAFPSSSSQLSNV